MKMQKLFKSVGATGLGGLWTLECEWQKVLWHIESNLRN